MSATTDTRRSPRRVRKVLAWSAAVLLALATLGATYQAVATARDLRAHPAPGVLIDVGGHRMHLHCVGQGSPTVVLEAALGATAADWAWVQRDVAQQTRVCAYDRAGMGSSEPGPAPRDAEQITTELHTLLTRAGIDGPYVLVGHSFGGLYTQLYTARHPEQVAGLVLVESSHPQQFDRLPQGRQNYNEMRLMFTLAPMLARLGVLRLLDLPPASPTLPPEQRDRSAATAATTRQIATTAAEFAATPDTTAQVQAAARAGSLGTLPLAVVTAGTQPAEWLELQNELTALSANSSHRTVAGATHTSVVADPAHAHTTSAAITQVVDAARTHGTVRP